MALNGQGRLFSYLLVGALATPLISSWSGAYAATTPHKADYSSNFIHGQALSLYQASATGPGDVGIYSVDAQAQNAFADPAFQRTWERTDKPVASGQVQRSWYWGPAPISGALQEDYAEGAGGKRLVQYFDKSRMEINDPSADPKSQFYVTNGLLTVELISGKMQTGNTAYTDRYPADIPMASDSDDTNAPTYLSFQAVSNTTLGDHPADSKMGTPATSTITRAGVVSDDPTKSTYPDVNIVYYDQTTRHNVPKAIWDFLNQSGPVYNSATGQTENARLSDPWFYATGLPISDAYWARVKIAGQQQDVLIQAFERRVVTYVPNGVPGFKVQMGNIGQHYYDWRYKNAGRPQSTPTPAVIPTTVTAPPTQPAQQPTATTPAAPTPGGNSDCSGIPAGKNATVTPNCGPGGTIFRSTAHGFQPGESVGIYVTDPTQAVNGAPFQEDADGSGSVAGVSLPSNRQFPAGIWAITFEGTVSHAKAVGYFKITAPPATATPIPGGGGGNAGCTDVPPSVNMRILPSNCGPAGTQFGFFGRGFQPGEKVGVYLTDPNGEVFGAPFQTDTDGAGNADPVGFTTDRSFQPGVWAMTMEGTTSHHKAIGYFKITAP